MGGRYLRRISSTIRAVFFPYGRHMDLFTYHPENGQMSLWMGTTFLKRNESSSSNHKCSGKYVSFPGGVMFFL